MNEFMIKLSYETWDSLIYSSDVDSLIYSSDVDSLICSSDVDSMFNSFLNTHLRIF
jgi:hypothetical protein